MLTLNLLNQLINKPWTVVRPCVLKRGLDYGGIPSQGTSAAHLRQKTLGHHQILSPPASNSAQGSNWPSFPTRAIFGQKIWTIQVLDSTGQRDQWPLMGRVEATNCVLIACSSPAFTGHFVRHSGQFSSVLLSLLDPRLVICHCHIP